MEEIRQDLNAVNIIDTVTLLNHSSMVKPRLWKDQNRTNQQVEEPSHIPRNAAVTNYKPILK
jgi:hypothetical protein